MNSLKSNLFLLLALSAVLSISSCELLEEACPEITCNNGGTLNDETCDCDCPDGFSGTNCGTEDFCVTNPIDCQNGGSLNADCTACECANGYTGDNCESFDASQVQALLANHTPIDLVNGGVPIDSLYGKMYEGGIIFYLNTTDGNGMVAATEDQSKGTRVEWGCFGTDIMDLMNVTECPGMEYCLQPIPEDSFEGARIGDGAANTDAILAKCTTNGIAAKLCRDLGEDWFLPSRGEFNMMYTNLHAKGHGGFEGAYWSSTELDDLTAWFHIFNNGSQTRDSKTVKFYVRAARAFNN